MYTCPSSWHLYAALNQSINFKFYFPALGLGLGVFQELVYGITPSLPNLRLPVPVI